MKAWLLDAQTGIDTIHIADIPEPKASVGEAVVALRFAALNPADRYLAEAQYPAKPAFPHILGRDGVGTIADVGAGVTNVKSGDRVVILRSEIGVNRAGTFAEKVAVPVESLAVIPAGWTDEQACAGAAGLFDGLSGADAVDRPARRFRRLDHRRSPAGSESPAHNSPKRWDIASSRCRAARRSGKSC